MRNLPVTSPDFSGTLVWLLTHINCSQRSFCILCPISQLYKCSSTDKCKTKPTWRFQSVRESGLNLWCSYINDMTLLGNLTDLLGIALHQYWFCWFWGFMLCGYIGGWKCSKDKAWFLEKLIVVLLIAMPYTVHIHTYGLWYTTVYYYTV